MLAHSDIAKLEKNWYNGEGLGISGMSLRLPAAPQIRAEETPYHATGGQGLTWAPARVLSGVADRFPVQELGLVLGISVALGSSLPRSSADPG